MFAISTLANAGLAMVLLVNLRPGASNHITDYAGCSDGQVTTVNRRNGHTGFTPFLLITLSNLATNILDSLLLLLAAGKCKFQKVVIVESDQVSYQNH